MREKKAANIFSSLLMIIHDVTESSRLKIPNYVSKSLNSLNERSIRRKRQTRTDGYDD